LVLSIKFVSEKVNYVVIGEDPGPAKLAKAETYNIPSISEDELLDLILEKSGMEPKYCKKNTSASSEDLGFENDNEVKPAAKEKMVDKETNKQPEVKSKKVEENDKKVKEPVKVKLEEESLVRRVKGVHLILSLVNQVPARLLKLLLNQFLKNLLYTVNLYLILQCCLLLKNTSLRHSGQS
jgi:BRCT domain type II-containing protein